MRRLQRGNGTRGSGLYHSGRPDLIEWVPKPLFRCRNVIIVLRSRPVNEASDFDRP